MNGETITRLKKFLAQRIKRLDTLSIDWFGGEPLLAKDIVTDICSFVCELGRRRKGFNFSSSMTTNGFLLTEDTVQDLWAVGVRHYQITLDGPKEIHDKYRVQANGSGSYEKIWHNLQEIKNSNLEISILLRLHLNPDNSAVIEAFTGYLKKQLLIDPRFSLIIKPVGRWGGPNHASIQTVSKQEADRLLGKCLALIKDNDNIGVESAVPLICYAGKPTSFVIRANGNLAKCTVVFNDERNNIGCLDDSGLLKIDNSRLQLWLKGIKTMDKELLSCPVRGLP